MCFRLKPRPGNSMMICMAIGKNFAFSGTNKSETELWDVGGVSLP